MTIYERLLDMLLRNLVEITLDQFSFITQITMDAVFIAGQVMEKRSGKNNPWYFAFFCPKKPYDRSPPHSLEAVIGVPERMTRTVQDMYEETTGRMHSAHGSTSKREISVGILILEKSTFDTIFITRQLMKKCPGKDNPWYFAFWHSPSEEVIESVPERMVRIVQDKV